jgi:hypothetical protein
VFRLQIAAILRVWKNCTVCKNINGNIVIGDRGSTVVKVLRYKSEDRWFDPRWCQFSIDINPSARTMALGSTQPLTEMSIRRFPGGKGGRCVWLTTLPPSRALIKKSGNLNFLEPSGPPQACNGTALQALLVGLQCL